MPDLTSERFLADPWSGRGQIYRTGDLARVASDGVVELVGRADRQVKIRGHRVEPEEVEVALSAHPDIDLAAVTVNTTTLAHNQLVAHVQPRHAELTGDGVREFLRLRLPAYLVPARVEMVEHMPLTPTGKIDRQALADLFRGFSHPRTEPGR